MRDARLAGRAFRGGGSGLGLEGPADAHRTRAGQIRAGAAVDQGVPGRRDAERRGDGHRVPLVVAEIAGGTPRLVDATAGRLAEAAGGVLAVGRVAGRG